MLVFWPGGKLFTHLELVDWRYSVLQVWFHWGKLGFEYVGGGRWCGFGCRGLRNVYTNTYINIDKDLEDDKLFGRNKDLDAKGIGQQEY